MSNAPQNLICLGPYSTSISYRHWSTDESGGGNIPLDSTFKVMLNLYSSTRPYAPISWIDSLYRRVVQFPVEMNLVDLSIGFACLPLNIPSDFPYTTGKYSITVVFPDGSTVVTAQGDFIYDPNNYGSYTNLLYGYAASSPYSPGDYYETSNVPVYSIPPILEPSIFLNSAGNDANQYCPVFMAKCASTSDVDFVTGPASLTIDTVNPLPTDLFLVTTRTVSGVPKGLYTGAQLTAAQLNGNGLYTDMTKWPCPPEIGDPSAGENFSEIILGRYLVFVYGGYANVNTLWAFDNIPGGTATVTQIAGAGAGGAVSSVFTRTGAVVAATGDYNISQIDTPSGDNVGALFYDNGTVMAEDTIAYTDGAGNYQFASVEANGTLYSARFLGGCYGNPQATYNASPPPNPSEGDFYLEMRTVAGAHLCNIWMNIGSYGGTWVFLSSGVRNAETTIYTTATATPVFDSTTVNGLELQAQGSATAITSITDTQTMAPLAGQRLHVAITGTGTQSITWGATQWESSTTLTLPTAQINGRMDMDFVYDDIMFKWRLMAIS